MSAALVRRLKAVASRSDGTTLIEFAIVAPVLFTLIFGILEFSMALLTANLLEGGLREAARFGTTGAFAANPAARATSIVAIINKHGGGLINISTSDVDTQIYPNFQAIGQPEPFTDTPVLNGVYDPGEPFTDINCNTVWDADQGLAGLGAGGEVVLYTVTFAKPSITGLFDPIIGNGGNFLLGASIAIRNEPFDTLTPGCTPPVAP